MLTIRQLFDDYLGVLGIDNPDKSPTSARNAALYDIRAALQLMQSAGPDYYLREQLSVSFATGTSSAALDGVTRVLDGARLASGVLLKRVDTRAAWQDFAHLFLGQTSRYIEPGAPVAFFVESLGDDSQGNRTSLLLHIKPTPATATSVLLDIIPDAPTYTTADLCSSPSPTPPVTNAYHESILRPLVRMGATSNHLFARHADRLPQIQADYERAISLLGVADPRARTAPPPDTARQPSAAA
jgi:hypothetical protein